MAISYAAKIPIQAIANALRGRDSEQFQEAVRVLDIILRQNAAQKYVITFFLFLPDLGYLVYVKLMLLFWVQGVSYSASVFFPQRTEELCGYRWWGGGLPWFSFKF